MQTIASELLLLNTTLSQLKSKERILSIYIDSIAQIFSQHKFQWIDQIDGIEVSHVPICTRNNSFGNITYQPAFSNLNNELALFQNSSQMLAIILENLENERLLNSQRDHLQQLVDKKTQSIIEKQDDLNEINEEYATLNDELLNTNQSLLKLNNELVSEITEHEKTLSKLKQSENYFKNIFNHASVGKSITKLEGELEVNDTFCEILGYSNEELSKLNWKEITHPEDIEYNEKIVADIISGKYHKATWEKRYLHKNGHIVWAKISTTLQRDSSFYPEYFITTIIDVTEQKALEEKFRESNQYLKSLFKYSNSPILAWDNCFIATRFNPAIEKLSGYTTDEIIGQHIDVLFSKETIASKLPYLQKTHEGVSLEGVEIEIRRKDGTTRNVVWNSAPIFNSEGNTIISTIALGNDITEMKEAMNNIIEGEKRLASIIAGTRAGTWEWNVQTGETTFNETWAEIIGYTIEELSPVSINTWTNLSHPDDLNQSTQKLEKHFSGQLDNYEHESRMQHKDGHWIWVLDRGKVTSWTEDGKPLLMYGTHQDITERKEAEISLTDSERFLNQSQKISLIGSYSLNIKSGIWKSSTMLDEIFGIKSSDDHSIAGWLKLIHPVDRVAMNNHLMNDVLGRKERFDKEYRIISVKNRKEKWVHGIGELELDQKGNSVRMTGTIQDITERKNVQNALIESNELLSHFVLHSPIYAFIKEVAPTESRVLKASENYIDMVGIPGSQMVGKTMHEMFPNELATKMTADDWQVVSNGIALKLDEELNSRYYTSIKFPIKLGDKNLLAGYTIDITDRKESELLIQQKNEELLKTNKELKKAIEKAEESDRLKSSFLANMSHEIRTPMNSIMGFASLLPDEESQELQAQYANIIVQNSEQLVSLIDGIVLYSKLQSRLFVCQPTLFRTNKLLVDVAQSFNLPDYQKEVKLIIDSNSLIDLTINSDYDKLRQVFTNLVSNAFKYTTKGEISIGCCYHANKPEFFVRDTGIGIPEKELSQIFERFYRGSNVDLSSHSGTGLGLSIVQELIELLGGKIWVESEIGVGTKFSFTLNSIH